MTIMGPPTHISILACKPGGAGSFLSFYKSLNRSQEMPLLGDERNTTLLTIVDAHNTSEPDRSCLHGQQVIREDLDVVSIHFRILSDSGVPVQAKVPTVFLLNLNSGLDNGGSLVVNLVWNTVSGSLWRWGGSAGFSLWT